MLGMIPTLYVIVLRKPGGTESIMRLLTPSGEIPAVADDLEALRPFLDEAPTAAKLIGGKFFITRFDRLPIVVNPIAVTIQPAGRSR